MATQDKPFLQQLQILFGALAAGQTMFLLVVYFFVVQPTDPSDNDDILVQVLPLAALVALVAGYFLFKMTLKKGVEDSDLGSKKSNYRAASLLKWACFEAAALILVVGLLVTNHEQFFIWAGLAILHFLLHFPSRARVSRELDTTDLD